VALDTTSALPGATAPTGDSVALGGSAPGGPPWGWIAAAVGFAALWLLTLAWAWRRRRAPAAVGGGPLAEAAPTAGRPSRAELRRALDQDGLDDIVALLAAMGGIRGGLEAVLAQLADPAQRQALQDLQAARWSADGGDAGQARQALRRAFHDGPHWQPAPAASNTPLPPLYPPSG
jgi:hypothetical protein